MVTKSNWPAIKLKDGRLKLCANCLWGDRGGLLDRPYEKPCKGCYLVRDRINWRDKFELDCILFGKR